MPQSRPGIALPCVLRAGEVRSRILMLLASLSCWRGALNMLPHLHWNAVRLWQHHQAASHLQAACARRSASAASPAGSSMPLRWSPDQGRPVPDSGRVRVMTMLQACASWQMSEKHSAGGHRFGAKSAAGEGSQQARPADHRVMAAWAGEFCRPQAEGVSGS